MKTYVRGRFDAIHVQHVPAVEHREIGGLADGLHEPRRNRSTLEPARRLHVHVERECRYALAYDVPLFVHFALYQPAAYEKPRETGECCKQGERA